MKLPTKSASFHPQINAILRPHLCAQMVVNTETQNWPKCREQWCLGQILRVRGQGGLGQIAL